MPFVDYALMGHVNRWCARADAFHFGARTCRNFVREWQAMNDPNDPIASALTSAGRF